MNPHYASPISGGLHSATLCLAIQMWGQTSICTGLSDADVPSRMPLGTIAMIAAAGMRHESLTHVSVNVDAPCLVYLSIGVSLDIHNYALV